MSERIEASELIGLLKEHGYVVDRDLLRKWSKAGLLPKGQRRFLGRGLGSETSYPSVAIYHAAYIVQLLKERRSYRWVGWRLWCIGLEVDQRYWKPLLTQAVDEWRSTAEAVDQILSSDDDHPLPNLIDDLYAEDKAPSAFKQIRKALEKEQFDFFAHFTLRMMNGDFLALSHDRSIDDGEYRQNTFTLDKAFGLTAARKHHIEGTEPWLTGKYSTTLRRLSHSFAQVRDPAFFRSLDQRFVEDARDEIFWFQVALPRLQNLLERFFDDPTAFGLQRISNLLSDKNLQVQASLLSAWILARSDETLRNNALVFINANKDLLQADLSDKQTERPKLRKTERVFPYKKPWQTEKF